MFEQNWQIARESAFAPEIRKALVKRIGRSGVRVASATARLDSPASATETSAFPLEAPDRPDDEGRNGAAHPGRTEVDASLETFAGGRGPRGGYASATVRLAAFAVDAVILTAIFFLASVGMGAAFGPAVSFPSGPPAKARAGGKGLYSRHCASCHGEDRKGTPPEFPSLIGIGEKYTASEISRITVDGTGRMPGFPRLKREAVQAIAEYLTISGSEVTRVAIDQNRVVATAIMSAGFSATYFIVSWVALLATPGQRFLGIRIARAADRRRLTLGQAAARWLLLMGPLSLGALVATLLPGLRASIFLARLAWYMILVVTTVRSRTKQGLHDRYAGSVVTTRAHLARLSAVS